MTPDDRRESSVDAGALREAEHALREANLSFARRYRGDDDRRQPIQTLIEGAQHFAADVAGRRGAQALRTLDEYAATPDTMGRVFGIVDHPALPAIAERVREKLTREPIEDYRIDFEDGYGVRAGNEEDRQVAFVAGEIERAARDGLLPPMIGVRIKPLTEELRERSVRTLDLLLTELVRRNALPLTWTITLPKVSVVEQVDYFVAYLRALERSLGLTDGTLTFEIMVEVPQAILDVTGRSLLPTMVDAAGGRLTAIDFGTYDYTAGVNISAAQQRLRHPACDFAKHMIQVAFAGTGIRIADGSTALLPVPVHANDDGASLNEARRAENAASVHAAWRLHFDDVRYSLANGFYQGWDLHAAQLVSRYAAVSSFYLEGVASAGARLRTFLSKATSASLVGGMLDEPATGQALLAFFLRGMQAGAISEREAMEATGLTASELGTRSIVQIMRTRGLTTADYSIER